jgi:membrane fusion protein, heavy metal efflux system
MRTWNFAFLTEAISSRLLVAVLCATLLAGCSKPDAENAKPATSEEAKKPERVQHGPNGEVIVTLNAANLGAMGLQTAALEPMKLAPEVKAYGRVLDVSGLATLMAELTTSRAAAEASQAELARLKTLSAQNNASARALQSAEAAAVKAQAQVESTRLRILAGWGSAIATRQDLVAFVQSLSGLESALVEVDLPAGEPLKSEPTGAKLFTVAEPEKPVAAAFLGPAPVVDPMMQGRGFVLLVSPNPARLTPGGAVIAFLTIEGEPQSGVLLPRSAVVRHNGSTWVYIEISPKTFQKTEVTLGQPLETGWFVREKVKPGEKVVTVAAQQLLSEELNTPAEE